MTLINKSLVGLNFCYWFAATELAWQYIYASTITHQMKYPGTFVRIQQCHSSSA